MEAPRPLWWYRFESRTTRATASQIPFDLFYVIPTGDLEIFSQVYDVFLKLEPDQTLLKALFDRNIQEYFWAGVTRDSNRKQEIVCRGPKQDEHYKLGQLLDERASQVLRVGACYFCVPFLALRKNGQAKLAYVMNRYAQSELTKRHTERVKNNWTPKADRPEILAQDMLIHVLGRPTLPCVTCTWGTQKLVNDSHCMLGTASCLEKIRLTGIETFSDKAAGGTTPTDYQEKPTLAAEA